MPKADIFPSKALLSCSYQEEEPDRRDTEMKTTATKAIQEVADLLNEGISSYYSNDDGFMETVNVISRMIETRCYKRDDDAYFANIRRELLRSLSAPSRYPLTVSRATACLDYYGIDLADE